MYLKIDKYIIMEKLKNYTEYTIEVKDLLKVFLIEQPYFITIRNQKEIVSLFKSNDLKRLTIYDKQKKYFANLQITFFLKSKIFKQFYYYSFNVKRMPESFSNNTKLLQKISKKWYCNKLKCFYLISFFQKKQIFNYCFEFFFFQFLEKTFIKEFFLKYKNFYSFRQMNKRKKVINKFWRNPIKISSVLLDSSLSKNPKYNDFSKFGFFYLNTSYLDLFGKSINFSLFSLVGQYWFEEPFKAAKSLSSNGVTKTINLRDKLKDIKKDKFKTKYNNIIETNSRKSLQYLINYYLFELNKKWYKITNYSKVKNLAFFEASLLQILSLKIEIVLKLFPLLIRIIFKNKYNLFFNLEQTAFFSRKKNILEFYSLKQIFNLCSSFYFRQLLSKSTQCVDLKNFCHKLIKKNFSQPYNSIDREFYCQLKKDKYYLLSLNISIRNLSLINFEKDSIENYYLSCFDKNHFEYWNRRNLKFLSIESKIFNSFSYRKLIYLNKILLSINTHLVKLIDLYSENFNNIYIFLYLAIINSKTHLEIEIQKVLFDSFKKINLWVYKNFFTKKMKILVLAHKNPSGLALIRKTPYGLVLARKFVKGQLFGNSVLKSLYMKISKKEEKNILLRFKKKDWLRTQGYMLEKFKKTDFVHQHGYFFISQKKRFKDSFICKNGFLFQCFISIFKLENQLFIFIQSTSINVHFENFRNFITEFKTWYSNYSNRVIKLEDFFSKVPFTNAKGGFWPCVNTQGAPVSAGGPLSQKNGQVIFIKSELQRKELKENVYKQIKSNSLDKKTSSNITIIHQGSSIFFLNNGSFFISPTPLNIFLYLKILKKIIKESSTKTQEVLIIKLSAKIYSWCYHYNYLSNQKVLNYCDYRLLTFLWRWACRRHTNKSKKWIQSKYFYKFSKNYWIFGNSLYNSFEYQYYSTNSLLIIYLPFHSQIFLKLKKII